MASDNRANYAVIGFTVIAGIVAIAASLVYLGGIRGRGSEILVETYYDHAVNGLSVGSDVNFRGVKIGKVREISFVSCKYNNVKPSDGVMIYILLALDPKMMGIDGNVSGDLDEIVPRMVDHGLRVTVSASGITGMSRVECDMPISQTVADTKPYFKPTWNPDHLYVPSKISLLDNFSDSATKVMNQLNTMDFAAVWSNIHESVATISRLAYTTESLVAGRQDEIDRIVGNVEEATVAAKELMLDLRRDPSILIRNASPESLPETQPR